MTVKDIEIRGWKDICEFLRVRSKSTAKKFLKRRGLLCYEGGRPVVNIEIYNNKSRELSKVKQGPICADVKKSTKRNTPPLKEKWLSIRYRILKRDDFTCRYCGRSPIDNKAIKLQIDHIIPVSKNGSNNDDNLITACGECNAGKGDVLLSQRVIEKIKMEIG